MPAARRRVARVTRNPFIIGHHAEGENFCDRRAEVERVAAALRDPGNRLLVYGDRRLGKSSTIHEAARRVRAEGRPVVVVDLGVAPTAAAAAQRILTAVHHELGTSVKDLGVRLLQRLRPGSFSLQASADATGQPTLSFQISPAVAPKDSETVTDALNAVEAELGARKLTIGLAIDEFQRLGRWYGEDVGWQLKELLERHRRIAYVLAGSERSLIEQMIKDRKRALWKVVDVLDMQPVPPAEMARWIATRSSATGVALDLIVAASIVRLAGERTRDIVQLARATWDWARPAGAATRHAADEAMDALVREQGALHQRQWDSLTDVERSVLATITARPEVQLLAASTLREFTLGPKSTVASAVEELVVREVLVRQSGTGPSYTFDDPFFRYWIKSNNAVV